MWSDDYDTCYDWTTYSPNAGLQTWAVAEEIYIPAPPSASINVSLTPIYYGDRCARPRARGAYALIMAAGGKKHHAQRAEHDARVRTNLWLPRPLRRLAFTSHIVVCERLSPARPPPPQLGWLQPANAPPPAPPAIVCASLGRSFNATSRASYCKYSRCVSEWLLTCPNGANTPKNGSSVSFTNGNASAPPFPDVNYAGMNGTIDCNLTLTLTDGVCSYACYAGDLP